MRILKFFFASALVIQFAASAAVNPSRPGQFYGWKTLSYNLSSRLYEDPTVFSLAKYLGDDQGLLTLLGGYINVGTEYRFINGDPNGVNTLLYHFVAFQFSKDLNKLCTNEAMSPKLSPLASMVLQDLCVWPEINPEVTLENTWDLFFGFDANRDEFKQWKDFFMNEKLTTPLPTLIRSILLNPHFLLENGL